MQTGMTYAQRISKAVFVGVIMLLFLSKFADAKVNGATCSTCHTMHNSQNGSNMRLNWARVGGLGGDECLTCHSATRVVLLRLDCIGCHAQNPGGALNIIDPGRMPQVGHHAATDLAGGNYFYVYDGQTGSYSHGHNVHGFSNQLGIAGIDAGDLGNIPPGYKSDYDPSPGYQPGQGAGQVMCAGQNGCHGNRGQMNPILAMKGTHHADDSMLKFGSGFTESRQGGGAGDTSDFTTAGRSYRFLYNVHGAEDANWEANPSSTVHNEYRGSQFSDRGQTQGWGDVTTISDFCAECHGKFHAGGLNGDSGIGSASPWLRHPTDVVLPANGEYTAYKTYSIEAPIARQNIADGTSQASPNVAHGSGGDVVMCLSCHRAHASPYPDILRWDYNGMQAGGGGAAGGCFTCHTKKNQAL